jgi:hypothetical protein
MSRYEKQFDEAMERQNRSNLVWTRRSALTFQVLSVVVFLLSLTEPDSRHGLPVFIAAFVVSMLFGRWAKKKLQKLDEVAHTSEQAEVGHKATAKHKKAAELRCVEKKAGSSLRVEPPAFSLWRIHIRGR